MMDSEVSNSPDGREWKIPSSSEISEDFQKIRAAASGKKVVAVQGLGFVGAAVATAVAAARNQDGSPAFFVVGVDLATPSCWWKVASIREGSSPFAASDPEFANLLLESAHSTKNLTATSCEEAYALADIVLVDVQLDVISDLSGGSEDIRVDSVNFEKALSAVGRWMKSDALVLVETTVPIGMTQRRIRPLLEEVRKSRGIGEPLLLAHAYERVMPGKRYLESIRKFWRAFSADDAASLKAAEEFLESITDTSEHPLSGLEGTTASEMAKLLENSYRAANIAFIHEWTLLAEKAGVNLWQVVDAIRMRRGTHDNMRYPGFGVGGYCLTKDSFLAEWGAKNLLDLNCELPVTLGALAANYTMPLHTLDLLRECASGKLQRLRVLLCGVSYLADVADTRNSPSMVFADSTCKEGATLTFHDPLVEEWIERPGIPRSPDLKNALASCDAVVFAVPHMEYRSLDPSIFPSGTIVVDSANMIPDSLAAELRKKGCRLAGAGKGHWRQRAWQKSS